MVANTGAGCLTGPGSACRPDQGGGHRQLVTRFAAAVEAVRYRSHPQLLQRAQAAAVAAYGPLEAYQPVDGAGLPADITHTVLAPRRRALAGVLAEVAVSGVWPAGRYASSSEATYAVLTAAIRRGWSLAGVVAEMESGRWGGLAALYEARRAARTRRGGWRSLLSYEWRRALARAAAPMSVTPAPADLHHRGEGPRNIRSSDPGTRRPWLTWIFCVLRGCARVCGWC